MNKQYISPQTYLLIIPDLLQNFQQGTGVNEYEAKPANFTFEEDEEGDEWDFVGAETLWE